jgi:ADP-ribosylglycohydrolase
MAAIAGAVAEAFFGMPEDVASRVISYLDPALKEVTGEFARRFGLSYHGIFTSG